MAGTRLWPVLIAAFVCGSYASDYFPPYITPCHRNDPKLRECAMKQIELTLPHFAKGIPELEVPSLDPVTINDIVVNGNGLLLEFKEATMHGLSKVDLTDLAISFIDGEKFSLGVRGNLSLKSKYRIEGQVLLLNIKGSGDAKIKTKNLDVVIKSEFQRYKDETGEHLRLVSPSYTYKMERAQFQLQNLFEGNKELSEAVHQFANQNWKQLMDDLGPPVVKQIVKTCVKSINKFFSKVTVQQVLPD